MQMGKAPLFGCDLHDARRIAHGPPAQRERIVDSEQAGIEADGRAQSEQRDRGESGRAPKIAERVTEILKTLSSHGQIQTARASSHTNVVLPIGACAIAR